MVGIAHRNKKKNKEKICIYDWIVSIKTKRKMIVNIALSSCLIRQLCYFYFLFVYYFLDSVIYFFKPLYKIFQYYQT